MPYFDIEIKQLLSENADKFEVVFNPGTEEEFTDDVVFFALCDLREKHCIDEDNLLLENYIGVILPVLLDGEGGLVPELLSDYKLPSEQEVRLRKKAKPTQ